VLVRRLLALRNADQSVEDTVKISYCSEIFGGGEAFGPAGREAVGLDSYRHCTELGAWRNLRLPAAPRPRDLGHDPLERGPRLVRELKPHGVPARDGIVTLSVFRGKNVNTA
jgi:hypothetical protein